MNANINQEVRKMRRMTASELKQRYAEVFGEESRSNHKDYLVKRIAWRLQAIEEGDISEAARARAYALACDADLRVRAPRDFVVPEVAPPAPERTVSAVLDTKQDDRLPIAGTELIRRYKGKEIVVTVLEDGFQYEETRYRSLSAIAKAVTGTHWNGYDFFGLVRKGGSN